MGRWSSKERKTLAVYTRKKRDMKKTMVMAAFAAFFVVGIYTGCNCSRGIVGLEGYAHGVAFCGDEFSWLIVKPTDESHYDKENNITYVINHGHGEDPEVEQLKDLATTECAQYK